MAFNVDIAKLFESNNVTFKDEASSFTINGIVVPKDGYSDGLRLYEFALQRLAQKSAQQGLTIPTVINKLGEMSPAQQWTFKKFFDEGRNALQPNAAARHVEPRLWGDAYVTFFEQYLEEDGETARAIPLKDSHFYNIVLAVREKKDFVAANPGFKLFECAACPCKPIRHFHAHSSAYNWAFLSPDKANNEPTADAKALQLAPPISFIKALDCVVLVAKTTNVFEVRMAEYEKRANEARPPPKARAAPPSGGVPPEQPSSPPSDAGEDGDDETGAFGGSDKTYSSADSAYQVLWAKNDLIYLQSVVRLPQNDHWKTINAPSKNAKKNTKATLNAAYLAELTRACNGKETLSQLLERLAAVAGRLSARNDVLRGQYLGWLMARVGAGDAKVYQAEDGSVARVQSS